MGCKGAKSDVKSEEESNKEDRNPQTTEEAKKAGSNEAEPGKVKLPDVPKREDPGSSKPPDKDPGEEETSKEPKPAQEEEEWEEIKHEEPKEEQAGGHVDTILFEGDKLLKKAKKSELKFWDMLFSGENTDSDLQEFKQFIPKFFGIEDRNGTKYLVLENLLAGYEHPNFMDVKLGKVTWTPYKEEAKVQSQIAKNKGTTTGELGMRVTGLVVKDSQGNNVEQSFKNCFSITVENVHEYFAKIASVNGEIQQNVVKEFIEGTEKILGWFKKQRSRKFIASSLFYVNGKNHKCQVKYIDFAHALEADGEPDTNVIEGIENAISTWKKLI